jgi:molybdopterin-guanine dinucleotide biosynthesis protein A
MILGAVLAGGMSRRFGTDKATALWRGRPLLSHAADALAPHCDLVVVSGGNRAAMGFPTVPDWPRSDLGPLGGICGAMRHARDADFATIVTIACDTPVVPASVFIRLLAASAPAYVRGMPVLGCWPADRASELAAYLEQSPERSIIRWAKRIGAIEIEVEAPIPNVNRPDDLTELAAS